MMDLFDRLGGTLNDAIGSHDNNNVGWAHEQIFGSKAFADGGEVGDTTDLTNNNDNSAFGYLKSAANAAKPFTNGRQDTSAVGGNYTNSPEYMMQKFSQLGKFFSGAESGNKYTDRYANPQQTNPAQSTKATDFYAKWYENMRRFAEAEEVTNRGQVKTKSV